MTIDIKKKIESDFLNNSKEVYKLFEEAINKHDYLNNNRIIRCIIYLSKGNIETLKHSIKQAVSDPRDVMLWAEYINLGAGQNPKRIRDFNKTFEECETNVKE